MAFYRPTKRQNSLFFIAGSSSGGDSDFVKQQAVIQQKNLSIFDKLQQNVSTFDKSDLLAVRSTVEEEKALSKEEVGGISNIPGLSSSEEEKLLEYSGYQVETTTVSKIDLNIEDEDQLFEDEEQFESVTREMTNLEDEELFNPSKKPISKIKIVSNLLRTVENSALQGSNCVPGTDLNLGERIVNRYAQVTKE